MLRSNVLKTKKEIVDVSIIVPITGKKTVHHTEIYNLPEYSACIIHTDQMLALFRLTLVRLHIKHF